MAKPLERDAKTRPLLTGQTKRSRKSAPGTDHVELKIWLRLLDISNQIKRRLATRLRVEFGTSMARFDLLAQLERADTPALSMSALSSRVMVTNGAITGVVDGLVRDGLVSRRAHAGDRRTVLVRLTALGRRKFLIMARRHEHWVIELFAGVPPGLKAQFQEQLTMMKRQLHGGHATVGGRFDLER